MKSNTRRNLLQFCGLILLSLNVCDAVKINSVTVPSVFERRDDADVLKLECDFTVGESETGFVLKWLHNNIAIYQWIPSKKYPFALGSFKGRVDVNYTTSDDRYKKHSALVITKPALTDGGNYTCSVQTFQSSDKQSVVMQIINPEKRIDLTYNIDPTEDIVNLKCFVEKIAPLPEVTFLFDNAEREELHVDVEQNLEELLYNLTVTTQVKKSDIKDESSVACQVKIPNTEYVKRETVTYDDPKQTATTKSLVGELTKAAGASNENSAHGLKYSALLLFSSALIAFTSINF